MLMLKTVTFESHSKYLIHKKVLNESKLHYSILKSFYYQLLDACIKNMMFHLKRCDLDLILTTSSKVKSMIPSYVSLRTTQLLFETFFHIYHSFREILMHYLKWDIIFI